MTLIAATPAAEAPPQQAVRIVLGEQDGEPPKPVMTKSDEIVAEAYAEVQKQEERLAALEKKLKTLRAAETSDDEATAQLEACIAERDEVSANLDRLNDVAAKTEVLELSAVLRDQSAQCRQAFTSELRLASDVLYRTRPKPRASKSPPRVVLASNQIAIIEQEKLDLIKASQLGSSRRSAGGASGAEGVEADAADASFHSPSAMSSRRGNRTPRSRGGRNTPRTSSLSHVQTPQTSGLYMGEAAGGSGGRSTGGGVCSMGLTMPFTCSSSAVGGAAESLSGGPSSSSVGIGATAAAIRFAPPSPRGGCTPRSVGYPTPRSGAYTPRGGVHSPRAVLSPLGSRASLHVDSSAARAGASAAGGSGAGHERSGVTAASGSSPRSSPRAPPTSSLLLQFGEGPLTTDMFRSAQEAYMLEQANQPVPRHAQLSRVPKPSLLRRSPAIAATPGIPFSWHPGPPLAVGPIIGLFARSPRLDEPLDYDPRNPIVRHRKTDPNADAAAAGTSGSGPGSPPGSPRHGSSVGGKPNTPKPQTPAKR